MKEFTPQQLLRGFTPQQILEGFTPQQVLEGLSAELAELIRQGGKKATDKKPVKSRQKKKSSQN